MIDLTYLTIVNANYRLLKEEKIKKEKRKKAFISDLLGATSLVICILGLYIMGCCF